MILRLRRGKVRGRVIVGVSFEEQEEAKQAWSKQRKSLERKSSGYTIE
jgi:hypothetical protein